MNQITTQAPQLPSVGMDALTRAEIDLQIETAKRFPRELTIVKRNVLSLVTMDREFAESCMFALPRAGKAIKGPSIRLAEVLFSQWGNCTGGSRTVDVNRKEGYVEAEGVFHDLETNAKSVRRVRRRILDKNGRVFSDDMIIVTANAAGAIAFRNAVFSGVPRAMWDTAYREAERLVAGDSKTLEERKAEALKAMAAFGLTEDEVCAILGVSGWDDIMLDEIVTIRGLHNSLREGEVTRESLLAQVDDNVVDDEKPKTTQKKSATTKAKPSADPKPEPEPKAEPAKEAEEKQDEKSAQTDEKTTAPAQDDQAVERFRSLASLIQKDLVEVGLPHLQDVLDAYHNDLNAMEQQAPNLHAEIMGFIENMKNSPDEEQ